MLHTSSCTAEVHGRVYKDAMGATKAQTRIDGSKDVPGYCDENYPPSTWYPDWMIDVDRDSFQKE